MNLINVNLEGVIVIGNILFKGLNIIGVGIKKKKKVFIIIIVIRIFFLLFLSFI